MLQKPWRAAASQKKLGPASPGPYGLYLNVLCACLCGLVLGLLATWAAINAGYGFGSLVAGPWTAWPQTGVPDIDPYARAALAGRGEAPLARGLGLAFVARVDSSGEPLDGRCSYRISSPVPPARFWTIGLFGLDGAPLANDAQRYAYSSGEVLRREGGGFDIEVARNARPGNWLSPGKARSFVIALRLYDMSIDASAKPDPSAFPSIVRQACS
ncbi:DUF1214 domain-containing protein [Methylocystis bryophila]|uniref:DUF1214 domain-containing protein n=1 Tax=Methylocystis bryophila TaxID=655015 RepID=UPI001FD920D0|nr:DUF1214 domain-containing protein [Methylocystis bryophila]